MRPLPSTTKATAGLRDGFVVFFGIVIISHYAPLFPSHFLSCFGDDDFFECFFTQAVDVLDAVVHFNRDLLPRLEAEVPL